MKLLQRFCADEDGAISVDFVVLTASICTLGLVVGLGISTSAEDLNNKSVAQLANMTPDH